MKSARRTSDPVRGSMLAEMERRRGSKTARGNTKRPLAERDDSNCVPKTPKEKNRPGGGIKDKRIVRGKNGHIIDSSSSRHTSFQQQSYVAKPRLHRRSQSFSQGSGIPGERTSSVVASSSVSEHHPKIPALNIPVTLSSELRKGSEQVSFMKRKMQRLEATLEEKQKEIKLLQKHNEKHSNSQKSTNAFQSALLKCKDRLRKAEAEVHSKEAKLGEMIARNSELQKLLEINGAKLRALQKTPSKEQQIKATSPPPPKPSSNKSPSPPRTMSNNNSKSRKELEVLVEQLKQRSAESLKDANNKHQVQLSKLRMEHSKELETRLQVTDSLKKKYNQGMEKMKAGFQQKLQCVKLEKQTLLNDVNTITKVKNDLQRKLDHMKGITDDDQTKIEKLTSKLQQLKDESQTIKEENQKLRKTIKDNAKNKKQSESLDVVKKAMEQSVRERDILAGEIDSYKSKLRTKTTDLKKVNEDLQVRVVTIGKQITRITELERELKKHQDQNVGQKSEITNLQNRLKNIEDELLLAKKEMLDKEKIRKGLEQEIQNLDQKKENWQNEKEKLENELKIAGAKMSKLDQEHKSQHGSVVKELQFQIEELAKKARKIESEKTTLSKKCSALEKDITLKVKEAEKLQEVSENLTKENEKIHQQYLNRVAEMKTQKEKFEAEIAKMQKRLVELTQQAVDRMSLNEQAEGLQEEILKLQTQVQKLQKQLKAEMTMRRKENEEKERNEKFLRGQIQALETDNTTLQREVSKWKKKYQDARAESQLAHSELEDKYRRSSSLCEAQRSELEERQKQLTSLRKELLNLRKREEEANADQLSNLNDEISILRKQLSTQRANAEKERQYIEDGWKDKLKSLEGEMAHLKVQHKKEYEIAMEDSRGNIERLLSEMSDLQAENVTLKGKITKLRSKAANASAKNASMEDMRRNVQDKLKEYKEKVEAYSQELEQASRNSKSSSASARSLKVKLQKLESTVKEKEESYNQLSEGVTLVFSLLSKLETAVKDECKASGYLCNLEVLLRAAEVSNIEQTLKFNKEQIAHLKQVIQVLVFNVSSAEKQIAKYDSGAARKQAQPLDFSHLFFKPDSFVYI
eukprot:g1757.t1